MADRGILTELRTLYSSSKVGLLILRLKPVEEALNDCRGRVDNNPYDLGTGFALREELNKIVEIVRRPTQRQLSTNWTTKSRILIPPLLLNSLPLLTQATEQAGHLITPGQMPQPDNANPSPPVAPAGIVSAPRRLLYL